MFDCSAEFEVQSLNQQLLQGPDLTNSLLGVLCHFRQEPVAFACDIEWMCHQVRVNEDNWHLVGAGSLPGCANLVLKTTAKDNERKFGTETAEFHWQISACCQFLKVFGVQEKPKPMVSKLLAQALIDKKYICVSDSADYANLTLSEITLPSDKDTREGDAQNPRRVAFNISKTTLKLLMEFI